MKDLYKPSYMIFKMDEIKTEASIIEDKSGKAQLDQEALLRERKEKVLKFLKTRYNWITYAILAIIVFISVRIRTRNLPLLRDITTGTWTLGPDLDPFLFLRWAKYIVENGSLYAVDYMRYVPIGFNTKVELLLHPYMMAWFHKIAVIFGSDSVTHSAVIYPVFMFALTVIAVFLFSRKIFSDMLGERKANIIALISALLLSIIPALLPRTIAGIPEKESVGFLFLTLAFYFFLWAWKSKTVKGGIILGIVAGISTAAMALVWGGYIFIYFSIGPAVLISFLLGSVDKKRFYTYLSWMISSFSLMYPFSFRYSVLNLVATEATAICIGVLFIICFDRFIYNPYLKDKFKNGRFSKLEPKIISIIIALLAMIIIVSVFFGPSFIFAKINHVFNDLISPASSRFQQTVAENRQPFFGEWGSSFGPIFKGIPIFFMLFFVGSMYLFYNAIRFLHKKDRMLITLFYIIMLFFIVFSRYSPESMFNGTNLISKFSYILGVILFIGSCLFYYNKYEKKGEEDKLKSIDFGIILLLAFFLLSLVVARGAVRTIMVLVPSASIIVAYFCVASFSRAMDTKDKTGKIVAGAIAILIILIAIFSAWQFYNAINGEAQSYAPSIYTQQWQKAMSWVRDNTPQSAVFGHWWDYGYWIQSIGERATVLDGGNAQGYWNHMMGRYALTGDDNQKALEFLYAHNTTHFLIDSTDIGKYTAFSSIGSDINFDRRSWIAQFLKDNAQIKETKNSTIFVYNGGTVIDEDIIYENNGTNIFLPAGKAGLGAVLIEKDKSGAIKQPIGIFVYQNQQYNLPLKYAYAEGKFNVFGSGIEAGVFIFPSLNQNQLEIDGALLYLSKRTVKSQLARLYLYKEANPNFKLVHSEDDFLVAQIKASNPEIGDIVYYGGVRGPIRIWEINYPSDIKLKDEYLQIEYPEDIL